MFNPTFSRTESEGIIHLTIDCPSTGTQASMDNASGVWRMSGLSSESLSATERVRREVNRSIARRTRAREMEARITAELTIARALRQ